MEKHVCLFIGRFQPYHNGHSLVIQGMVKVCDRVVIAIGSSDSPQNAENPFTAEERKDMIQRSLQELDIIPKYDVDFIEVSDYEDDEEWARTCLDLAKDVTEVWTGNDWTKKCFENTDVAVKDIKEVPGISATEVRRRMIAGEDWKEIVPEETVKKIIEIDGVERLRKFAE